jgi:hypothetical protein
VQPRLTKPIVVVGASDTMLRGLRGMVVSVRDG